VLCVQESSAVKWDSNDGVSGGECGAVVGLELASLGNTLNAEGKELAVIDTAWGYAWER